jgi:hypothetical protein
MTSVQYYSALQIHSHLLDGGRETDFIAGHSARRDKVQQALPLAQLLEFLEILTRHSPSERPPMVCQPTSCVTSNSATYISTVRTNPRKANDTHLYLRREISDSMSALSRYSLNR